MSIKKLSVEDGSWPDLLDIWKTQCEGYGQDFDEFAVATFGVLNPLAADGHPKAEVYGFHVEDECWVVCEANHTLLPGYDGYVLRVRNMTFAPRFDFGDVGVDAYGKALTGLFGGILALSHAVRPAPHIKFHLRSPADRTFFQALTEPLLKIPLFDTVEVKGAWLYVTKKQ
jgi:hypothetical protein